MLSGLTYSMTSKLVLLSVTENIVYNNCGLVNSNIFEIKSDTVSTVSPSLSHEVMGLDV